jgi:eight-cysteine-cluster-containing protein
MPVDRTISILVSVLAVSLSACVSDVDDPFDIETAERQLTACPAIAILCAPGYTAKQLPNCREICVPDNQPAADDDDTENVCVRSGCSGQICVPEGEEVFTTCEWREEYACYDDATCELQEDGDCGWTYTDELAACLAGS